MLVGLFFVGMWVVILKVLLFLFKNIEILFDLLLLVIILGMLLLFKFFVFK